MVKQVLKFARDNRENFLDELQQVLRIPSVSTLPEHGDDMVRMAEWLRVHMLEIGLEQAGTYETDGHPVVYGEWLRATSAPTVLIYGHYDVQPIDPIDEWKSSPFEPTIKDEYIYARGVSDDKAQFFTHLKAMECWLRAEGKLPVNVKVLLEGEEELGSLNLERYIKGNKEMLHADTVVISDTHMGGPYEPELVVGLRGLVYFEIEVETGGRDLHSGTYGGGVGNAALVLAQLLAKLKDDKQRVTVPGFYDEVETLNAEEIKKVNVDEKGFRKSGDAYLYWAEPKMSPALMPKIRPSLDVNGILAGFTGQGPKTVIPSKAMAKVSMRLVAKQNPDKIAKSFSNYVKKLIPKGVKVRLKLHSLGAPVLVSDDSQALMAAKDALEKSFGGKVKMTKEGGSIPVVEIFQRVLDLESVLMGYGLPDDNLHAPNERFYLPNFYRGIEANIRFYTNLSNLGPVPN